MADLAEQGEGVVFTSISHSSALNIYENMDLICEPVHFAVHPRTLGPKAPVHLADWISRQSKLLPILRIKYSLENEFLFPKSFGIS